MQPPTPAGGKRKDEDEREVEVSPFAGLQKNNVLREARVLFNQPQLNPQKCSLLLTKILYLINQGETLTKEEAIEVFFSVTKLFQSQDVNLRRMVYLVIKDLKVDSDSSLIVVSCLSKDMTSDVDLFRANAIRVLAKVMDAAMVGQIERFLKQAIVDKNPFIVGSTLVAGQHLFNVCPDVIKRWTNEVQEALSNKSKMVQLHALALLYKIKQHDRLAISKVVTAMTRNAATAVKGPLAQCLQIRIVGQIMQLASEFDAAGGVKKGASAAAAAAVNTELLSFLNDCLHNKQTMVTYEAARVMCHTDSLSAIQLAPAIAALQDLLNLPVSTQRFAAVRTLSHVVTRYPLAVAPCTNDLERLISDPNRSIATLAITTLLKTGVESNVDRLMKSIQEFMADISDEFKIVLVDAIKTLCLKFPHKHQQLLNFLATALREEGGFKFKKAIVDAVIDVIQDIKDAKDLGLEHFCEFIEDCEFPELSVKILYLLGEKGPKTANPAKYIRFIFNRVILETACVRAAAVSSLAKFGAAVPALHDNVVVLLRRCLNDNDDEVRDRALFHLNTLTGGGAEEAALLAASHGLPVPHHTTSTPAPSTSSASDPSKAAKILFIHPGVSLNRLEQSLQAYVQKNDVSTAFNLARHLVAEEEVEKPKPKAADARAVAPAPAASSLSGVGGGASSEQSAQSALLQSIPEIAALGKVFKSCAPIELTETETEYVVSCIKHIYPQHIVFQFNVTNNLEEQLLENVRVDMETEDQEWSDEFAIPEQQLRYHVPGTTFVCFSRPKGKFTGTLSCTLKFWVKEVDGEEVGAVGVEDEYQLEDIEVHESDFMKRAETIGLPEFKRQWETMDASLEAVKKYSLGLDSLQAAVDAVMDLLGMAACENSNAVAEGARSHGVNLMGTFFGDVPVLCRGGFMMDAKHGVTLKIAVRSKDDKINKMLTNAIR